MNEGNNGMDSYAYVDINTATVEDFVTRLNGVGQSKAKAIIRFRTTYGKFKEVRQLTEVPGITQFILDRNEGILSCDEINGHQSVPVISVDMNFCDEPAHSSNSPNHRGKVTGPTNQCQANKDRENLETPVSYSPCDNITPVTDKTRHTMAMTTKETPIRSVRRTRNALLEDGGMATRSSSTDYSNSEKKRIFSSNISNQMNSPSTQKNKSTIHETMPEDVAGKTDLPSNKESSGNKDSNSVKTSAGNKILMKRKLDDQRSDSGKYPEKKPCKSSSWVPSPNAPNSTFGEIKAEVTRSVLSRPQITDITHTPQDSDFVDSSDGNGITAFSPAHSPSRLSDSFSTTSVVRFAGLDQWIEKFQSWSPSHRQTALDELIDICEPRQVRHMLEVIEPQFQRDFISLLPKELALYVLSFLDPRSLLTAAQTCRYWHLLAEDNLLWREKCAEEGIKEPYYPRALKGSWRNYSPNIRPSEWKSSFIRQHKIEMNWRNGNEKSLKLLKGHDDHVITCLQFKGNRIVSGSDDNTLKVWSAVSGKCLRTLSGHTGGVWASQIVDNFVISGSTDRTLKIWNIDSGECIHTLYGHTSTVRCMALHGNTCVSGSRDATLRVWNIESGACQQVLMGHLAAVRCVCYDGKRVVSGAYDYNVKIWDPETNTCLHTLEGHQNRVYSLQFDGVHVVSGSLDTSIKVWSVDSGKCLHTLVGHQSLTSGMELKDNILVSGNADSTVKIWDIVTGECLKTLEGSNKHQSAVTCLQFNGKFVITSSDDGTVKLWDVETGKVIRDLVALDSRGSGGVVWRIRASETKLICAVGSRNGTEETKLLALDFDSEDD